MIADTNFLLDLLFADRQRHKRALSVVSALRTKKKQAVVTAATAHEMVYILGAPTRRNGYGLSRADIHDAIGALAEEEAFAVQDGAAIGSALGLFDGSRLDFHDCYVIAMAIAEDMAVLSSDKEIAKYCKTVQEL